MVERDDDRESAWLSSGIDLDSLSTEEVINLIVKALDRLAPEQLTQVQNAIIEKRRTREHEVREALVAEFRERALAVGIPLEALFATGRHTRSGGGMPLAPKYRGPLGEEWSGRGRKPRWMAHLEAAGHNVEEFRIKTED